MEQRENKKRAEKKRIIRNTNYENINLMTKTGQGTILTRVAATMDLEIMELQCKVFLLGEKGSWMRWVHLSWRKWSNVGCAGISSLFHNGFDIAGPVPVLQLSVTLDNRYYNPEHKSYYQGCEMIIFPSEKGINGFHCNRVKPCSSWKLEAAALWGLNLKTLILTRHKVEHTRL